MGFSSSARRAWRRFFFAATLLSLPLVGVADEVRIGGTGNALGTMRLLGAAFTRLYPATRIVIIDSIGTSGAIKALPKGAVDIGLSSRALTDEEIRSGLSSVDYARSPTVFAVNSRSSVASITLRQVAEIYSGKLTVWPDGSKIRPVMRQPGDDNTRQVRELSPEIEQALAVAETREGLTYTTNDQDTAGTLERVQGSIGVTTVALIRSENRNLRPLAIAGVEPSIDNMQSGRYPMVKEFHFVLPGKITPATRQFLEFVKSPPGRKILEENGHAVP